MNEKASLVLRIVTGLSILALGATFMVASVCNDFVPMRAIAGCALFFTASKV